MFENKTEEQAKKEILDMVAEYCDTFHNKKKEFEPGDRITYASRVYDHEEMCNLVHWNSGLPQEDIPMNLKKLLQNILE